jgi:hypothetical protein
MQMQLYNFFYKIMELETLNNNQERKKNEKKNIVVLQID